MVRQDKALRLVGLLRVSTLGQVKGRLNGDGETEEEGFARQAEAVEAIARTHKATDLRIIKLRGVHGYSVAQSPEWKAAVTLLRRGWHLAVQDSSRLLRAEGFDFDVLRQVAETGALVYSPSGVLDLKSPQGAMISVILGAVDGNARHRLLETMRGGQVSARKRGEWAVSSRNIPPGCTYDPEKKRWGHDPARVGMIRDAFDSIAGGSPILTVAKRYVVDSSTVVGWIRHPIYRGCLPKTFGPVDLGSEIRVYGGDGQEAPIVPEAVWRTANARLDASRDLSRKRRDKAAPAIWASTYLFSAHEDIFANIEPGKAFSFADTRAHHIVYGRARRTGSGGGNIAYLCRCCYPYSPRSPRLDKCGIRPLRADRTNAALDVYLSDLTRDPGILKAIRAGLTVNMRNTSADETRIRKGLAECDRREGQLVDMHLDGALSRTVYDTRRAKIERDRAALIAERDALAAGPKGPTAADLDAFAAAWTWDPAWDGDRKRAWLARYVPGGIRVSNKGIAGVRLRIPTAEGGADVLVLDAEGIREQIGTAGVVYPKGAGRTWESLIGVSALASDRDPKVYPAGTVGTGTVARRLGVSLSRLTRAMNDGRCQKPALWSGRHLCWTETDIAAAVKAFADPRKTPAA